MIEATINSELQELPFVHNGFYFVVVNLEPSMVSFSFFVVFVFFSSDFRSLPSINLLIAVLCIVTTQKGLRQPAVSRIWNSDKLNKKLQQT